MNSKSVPQKRILILIISLLYWSCQPNESLTDQSSNSASFIAEPMTGIYPLTVTFINTSVYKSNSDIQFEWDFGNGYKSSDKNPEKEFELIFLKYIC